MSRHERERAMLERIEVRESPIHGKGVFARRRLRPGQWIGRFEGDETTENGTYVLWLIDEDGSDDLVLGFADYASRLGVMVGYDLQSGTEQTAYDYSGYVFSHSAALNIVDTAIIDDTNGRLLVDVGYADYYDSGYGWFKAVDSQSFASGVASDGQWALVDQDSASVKYR